MKIKIQDRNKCKNCTKRTCSMNDILIKGDFYNLKTEHYTCPIKLFVYGLTDKQLETGYIDIDSDNKCLYCYLCVFQCSQNNLIIEEYEYDARNDFKRLKNSGELYAKGPSNVIAMSYLNILFNFAANTNLIRPLSFDGAMLSKSNKACLVEVDIWNDSLECCRRLLADIILNNYKNDRKISSGLMILNDFPKVGSSDVLSLIKKIKNFYATEHISIFICTFSLLRYFCLNIKKGNYEFEDLLFNASVESKEDYLQKLLDSGLIVDDISKKIFGES